MAKKKTGIELLKEEKADIGELLIDYADDNFDLEMSKLQADIFTDFITEKIGVYYYNKAIADASKYINEKAEDMFALMKD